MTLKTFVHGHMAGHGVKCVTSCYVYWKQSVLGSDAWLHTMAANAVGSSKLFTHNYSLSYIAT